jgi:hypothetical protein
MLKSNQNDEILGSPPENETHCPSGELGNDDDDGLPTLTPPSEKEKRMASAGAFLWDEDDEKDLRQSSSVVVITGVVEGTTNSSTDGGANTHVQGDGDNNNNAPVAVNSRLFGSFDEHFEIDFSDDSILGGFTTKQSLVEIMQSRGRHRQPTVRLSSGFGGSNSRYHHGYGRVEEQTAVGKLCSNLYHTILGCCSLLAEWICGPNCVLQCFQNPCNLLLCVVVVLAAVVGLLSLHEDDPSQARLHELKQSLVAIGHTDATALDITGSPQNMALNWLATEDPRQLQPDDEYLFPRYALAVLYYATGGGERTKTGSWINRPYWMEEWGYCLWYGIQCGGNQFTAYDKDEPILSLNLTNNGLHGRLPSEIFAITTLTILDLSGNSLSGTIPTELASMEAIEIVRLQGNKLSSSIPSGFGITMNGLCILDFSDNSLHGSIPRTISLASNLNFLSLSDNEISGSIPDLRQIVQLGET